ncbi:hypothetical protein [Antarctobacter jejuensis]|uniref:hypothetical protein n=1 Tax=Antarctobacter jejuensis TaxID=1439938 RepID=UPI003FD5D49F
MTPGLRCLLSKPGQIAGLCAFALTLSAGPMVPALADDNPPPETAPAPEAERAELIAAAGALEARIVKVLADMDADILEQEEAAVLSGSEAALAQIDALQDRRDALAKRLTEVRALIAALREDG